MTFIYPTWNAPNGVHALSTTRVGGVSLPPFDSLNLGTHVNDDPVAVQTNRLILQQQANLPQAPLYLNQVHSTKVVQLPCDEMNIDGDAVYTNQPNQVCLVMTADCLPVLFCSRDGQEVAATHAGWRGLCEGILENTVSQFHASPMDILVWLAPAISQKAFQVGEEVRQCFCEQDPNANVAFMPDTQQQSKYFADLYQLARLRLAKLGIQAISGGEYCTYQQNELFFSYRREQRTGRMATLIWRD